MSRSLTRRRVILAATTGWAGTAIAFGIRLFLTPFIIHRLGDTQYGLLALVGSVVAQGSLLDLGIGPAVTRYVAEYHTRKDYESARGLMATALLLYSVLGLGVLILGVVISALFLDIFQVPPGEGDVARTVVLLMFTQLAISVPCATAGATLRGLHKYADVNALSVGATIVSAVVSVAILLAGGGIVPLVAANIPVSLATQAATVWRVLRAAPELRFGWRDARRKYVKTLWSFSLSVAVMDVAYNIQLKIDEIIIGVFLPVSAVTPYSVARKIGEMPRMIADPFLSAFMPVSSQLHAEAGTARLKSLYLAGSRIHLAMLVPLAGIIIAFAAPLLSLWIGPAYAEYWPLVVILTVAYLMEYSHYPGGGILQGMARHHPLAIAVSCAGIGSLALSVALVRFYGLEGVAIGVLVPTASLAFGYVWPYTARTVGVTLNDIARQVFLPALGPALPMGLFFAVVNSLFEPQGLLALAFISALGCVIYYLFYFLLGAGETERQVLRGSLARLEQALGDRRPKSDEPSR